jgi:FkbM family methyltransferase
MYGIHYKIKRKINYYLFHSLYRLKYPDIKDCDIIRCFNYSKAIIDFFRVNLSHDIVSKSDLLNSSSIVIDVGGELGGFAIKIYEKYTSIIYIFEPHPDCVKILKEKFTDNKIRIFSYGLGSKNQIARLSSREMGSSIYEKSPGYEKSYKFEIEIRDIKEIFSELSLDDVDLIKINIEGGEYELLPRMIETGIINKCKIIRIQFHDWFPDSFAMRKRIVKQLAKTHNIEWSYPMVWESWIRKDIATNKF